MVWARTCSRDGPVSTYRGTYTQTYTHTMARVSNSVMVLGKDKCVGGSETRMSVWNFGDCVCVGVCVCVCVCEREREWVCVCSKLTPLVHSPRNVGEDRSARQSAFWTGIGRAWKWARQYVEGSVRFSNGVWYLFRSDEMGMGGWNGDEMRVGGWNEGGQLTISAFASNNNFTCKQWWRSRRGWRDGRTRWWQ